MAFQLTANALNHLFVQNSWASRKLAPFSGKTVRVNILPFNLAWVITPQGMLRNAEPNASPDVTCIVPPSLLPRFALMDEKAFDGLHFEGDVALSEAMHYVFRHLRWDAAEDISKITGDVAAERIVQGVESLKSLSPLRILNPLRPEPKFLVHQTQLTSLQQQLDALQHDLVQLEQRIQKLI